VPTPEQSLVVMVLSGRIGDVPEFAAYIGANGARLRAKVMVHRRAIADHFCKLMARKYPPPVWEAMLVARETWFAEFESSKLKTETPKKRKVRCPRA
jgi:hypothetical protein